MSSQHAPSLPGPIPLETPIIASEPAPELEQIPIATTEPSEVTLDSQMVASILLDKPLWKRTSFMISAGIVAILLAVSYGMNRQTPVSAAEDVKADLAVSDDGNSDKDPEDSNATAEAENQERERMPVPASLLAASASTGNLALGGGRGDEDAAAEAPANVKIESPAAPLPLQNDPAVRFAYKSAKLSKVTKMALDQLIPRMKADKLLKLRIEGHADERGTNKFNYQLGLRRANAAKAYLVAKGISGKRLVAVSFGKAHPAVKGHSEAAWSQNRRVEMRTATMLLSRR